MRCLRHARLHGTSSAVTPSKQRLAAYASSTNECPAPRLPPTRTAACRAAPRAAFCLTHRRISRRCALRALITESGSLGCEKKRSRWCAPSGMRIAKIESLTSCKRAGQTRVDFRMRRSQQ